MKNIKKILFLLLFVSLSLPVFAKEYTFGVVPQQSPVKLFKKWRPIVDYLSKKTGYTIHLKTEKSIAKFETVLYQGGYDFAYMNPYHYIVANQKQAYQAKVRAHKMIRGILVSQQPQLKDYIDKKNQAAVRYLFPAANAFAATLLLKYELLTQYGIDLNLQKNYQYVNSHDSVYKGIARGIGDVGGGVQRTFMNFDQAKDKDKLHIIYTTKPYPSHPFAFKYCMLKTAQDKIIDALLTMPSTLRMSLSMTKMITTLDAEYDAIRDLEKKLTVVERK
jgi:phosphonate transport system substrate-binding protein